jgi:putative restriction endonuclease
LPIFVRVSTLAVVAHPGTIAVTHYDWYKFLSERPYWDEVNFWTPSAHWTFRAPEFSPFLFKLKAPHKAIAGFGYFARYSALPEWLAWDCFGQANGCSSFEEMHARLEKIRRSFRAAPSAGIQQIGCIVVVNVTFFDQADWIPQPKDWPAPNLRPMRYDLDVGEGARVWAECLARVRGEQEFRVAEPDKAEEGPRYGFPVLVHPRLGQGAFRVSVTEAYHRACAVTEEHSLPALEAAHIRPFAKEGPHEVRNGLLLRADLHRLFEQGYMTVMPNYTLEISDRLRDDYHNGRSYYPLRGTRISVPKSSIERPTRDFLEWHNQNVFLQ